MQVKLVVKSVVGDKTIRTIEILFFHLIVVQCRQSTVLFLKNTQRKHRRYEDVILIRANVKRIT